ncbi:hypothetical protein MMC30_004643 [Trapelia coarctata]|nr:hypothetical protein [Trapelia coarctata]
MAHDSPDRRRVFLAYHNVFLGRQDEFRKKKRIRMAVEQQESFHKELMDEFGLDKIVGILVSLIRQGDFQHELKARQAFPEPFQATSSRARQHIAPEDNVAHFKAKLLKDVDSGGHDARSGEDNLDYHDNMDIDEPPAHAPKSQSVKAPKSQSVKAPKSYPLYLPYMIQHIILANTQRLLEECCFEFTTKWLPSVLKEENWSCVEAVELTMWTRIMARRCDELPAGAIFMEPGQSLKGVFSATDYLRHSAVHRLPMAAYKIHKLVQSAQKLAKTLGDVARAAQLETVRVELEGHVKDMELCSNFLENRLDEQLEGIAEQRAELDKKEREVTSKMLEEDQKSKTHIGSFLEATVRRIFGVADKPPTQSALEMMNTAFDDNEHKSRLNLADGITEWMGLVRPEIIDLTQD